MFSVKVFSFKITEFLQTIHLYFQSAHDKTIHFNLKKAYLLEIIYFWKLFYQIQQSNSNRTVSSEWLTFQWSQLSLSLWLSPDKSVLIEQFNWGDFKWKTWDGKLFVYNKLMTFIKLSL